METAFSGTKTLELPFALTLQELEIGRRSQIGHIGVIPYHVKHDDRAGPCLGFRFEVEGKVIGFSGDTEWTDTLINIGREADLFICEAYMRQRPVKTHMVLTALEQHLRQIRSKRLILTHMSNDMLMSRHELAFETADDGMIVEL
jgi:ribonuclease BN (tRNA processing enzyme)